ncbi:MAG: leucine-rich repeat domain-containing protein, partial [Chlamydiales bacterium]
MTQRVESSPHGANFVRYSEEPELASAVSYSRVAPDAVGLILSFVQEGRVSRVSRAWRQANRPVLQRTIQQMRFEDQASQAKMALVRAELAVSGETPEEAATLAQRVLREVLENVRRALMQRSFLHINYYTSISKIAHKTFLTWRNGHARAPGAAEMWNLRAIIFSRECSMRLHELLENTPKHHDESPAYEALLEQANRFTAEGNLALRLHKAIENRRINQDVAPALNALHERQREYARALGRNDERAFHPASTSDSHCYFLAVESEFQRHRLDDPEQTLALQRIWHGSAQDFAQNPPEDADTIRLRLMLPREVQNRTSASHENLSVIPPEIGRLTALEKIAWSGPLLGLPEEMEELTRLTHIFLRNTHFSELPSVLERIPNLELLSIENNQQPIRKISERLWTRLMGRGFLHTVASWFLAQKIRVIYNADLSQVREFPFEMCFLNKYTLPYIPSPMSSFFRIGHSDNRSFPVVLLIILCATPLAILNLPIFLANLFIATLVRP